MKGTKFLEFFVDVLITLGCGSFVAWQAWKCLHKYIDNRTAATIQLKNVLKNDNLYPAFTVCPMGESMVEKEQYCISDMYVIFIKCIEMSILDSILRYINLEINQ